MKSPLAIVKEKFGEKKSPDQKLSEIDGRAAKAKLVEAVKAFGTDELWLGRTASDRGKTKDLSNVSNAKLLRLHAIFTEVKGKFGSRAKLVDAILESEKRTKDAGYRTRLEAYPVPRLYDLYKSSAKRAKAAAAKQA